MKMIGEAKEILKTLKIWILNSKQVRRVGKTECAHQIIFHTTAPTALSQLLSVGHTCQRHLLRPNCQKSKTPAQYHQPT